MIATIALECLALVCGIVIAVSGYAISNRLQKREVEVVPSIPEDELHKVIDIRRWMASHPRETGIPEYDQQLRDQWDEDFYASFGDTAEEWHRLFQCKERLDRWNSDADQRSELYGRK